MAWSVIFLISGGLAGTQRCSFFLFFFMHMYVRCVDMEVCMFLGVWACKYTYSQVCGYASTHVHRCVDMQVHRGVWACKYTISQVCGQASTHFLVYWHANLGSHRLTVFSSVTPHLNFLRQWLPLNLEFTNSVRLANSKSQGLMTYLYFQDPKITGVHYHA